MNSMKKLSFILVLFALIMVSTQCQKEEEEKDTTAPVITLNGSNPMNVNKGSAFVDPGAKAIDDKDGDISNSIKVTGTVDTSTEGIYELKYNVEDAAGNAADEKTRTVKVMVF